MSVLNVNQFRIAPVVGEAGLVRYNTGTAAVIYKSSSNTGFQAGTPVILAGQTSTGAIIVELLTTTAQVPFGVIVASSVDGTYAPGDQVSVITGGGDQILMEASAAITAGQTVAINATSGSNGGPAAAPDSTTGHYVSGIAVTSAAGAGSIFKMEVKPSKNP
jgi:hypothetical protein